MIEIFEMTQTHQLVGDILISSLLVITIAAMMWDEFKKSRRK